MIYHLLRSSTGWQKANISIKVTSNSPESPFHIYRSHHVTNIMAPIADRTYAYSIDHYDSAMLANYTGQPPIDPAADAQGRRPTSAYPTRPSLSHLPPAQSQPLPIPLATSAQTSHPILTFRPILSPKLPIPRYIHRA